uniref:MATH domain-containing protein n=1 Tax=Leersia perrieri TaxID=77586 RepID=A0A0D9X410_9ORYZ
MAAPSSSSAMPPETTTSGTYVMEINGFSGLRKQHCGGDSYVISPETFTVAGLDWAVQYHPDGDADEETGHVAVFVVLVTKDATAWAHVDFRLLDHAAGEMVSFFREKDPILFDSGSEDLSTWGTGELAARIFLENSPYLAGDCLKIECSLTVCLNRLNFAADDEDEDDGHPPPLQFPVADDDETVDVTFEISGEKSTAHSSILAARAPGLLTVTTVSGDETTTAAAFRALLQFVYTDTLPAAIGDGGETAAMLRDILLAADRHGLARLAAICERAMCRTIDAAAAADTLAMADRHGFAVLRRRCAEFMASPDNYFLVEKSAGYGRLDPSLRREISNMYYDIYCSRYGAPDV